MSISMRFYKLLFIFLMVEIQAQGQTVSFEMITNLTPLDSSKLTQSLTRLKFVIKRNQPEDPNIRDVTEINKYEFKREQTEETVIVRNNYGRKTFNYLFFSKSHYIIIKNQIQKAFNLLDYEDDDLVSTESYESGKQSVSVSHMKTMNSYSVFYTIKE